MGVRFFHCSLFVHRVDAQLITADFQFLFVDVYTVLPLLPVLISPIGLLNICDTGLGASFHMRNRLISLTITKYKANEHIDPGMNNKRAQ